MESGPLPGASWRHILDQPFDDRHLVQFYDDPAFLQEAVARWSWGSLRAGGSAILVATPPHAALVRSGLAALKLDPPALERTGRLVVVDAHELMRGFMVGDLPDASRFKALSGPVLHAARRAAPRGEVRAWGEMVNVLWQRGNLGGAQQLEDLWNEVIEAERIRLLCSYAVNEFHTSAYLAVVRALTHGHGRLLDTHREAMRDRAVRAALEELFGEAEAATLWALFTTRSAASVQMPPAEAVLLGVYDVLPAMAKRLLARSQAHLQPA